MKNCNICGAEILEKDRFCSSCGAEQFQEQQEEQLNQQYDNNTQPNYQQANYNNQQQNYQQPNYQQYQQNQQQYDFSDNFQNFVNTEDSTGQFHPGDIQQNKVMAVLAYFGLLVLIPILAAKESPFARFHANQGLVLTLFAIAYYFVVSIFNAIILVISWNLYFITIISNLFGIVFLVFAILGIVNAANGVAKELPIIGKIKILK
ncbi:MAG: zinc ribbon domain-containing protein [Clostridiaceae bacterium]|nr:zinc ribbon domain-containing protein [Clostridiaceae bacterium]